MPPLLLKRPEDTLGSVLWSEYLIPAARWLIGPADSEYLLPQIGGSAWESSLSSWFLIDVLKELIETGEDPEFAAMVAQRVSRTLDWIAEQAVEEGHGLLSWESVTWDTAVCLRTLVRASLEWPLESGGPDLDDVRDLCARGLAWCLREVEGWDEDVMFSFGPSDLAQVLNTLVFIQKYDPDVLGRVEELSGTSPIERAHDLADYLIRARDGEGGNQTEQDPGASTSHDETEGLQPRDVDGDRRWSGDQRGLRRGRFGRANEAFWADYFQTSEVVESLALYVSANDKKPDRPADLSARCSEAVVSCMHRLEAEQQDGRWGTHTDTCRALFAYMRSTNLTGNAEPEPHIVLKSLRWVCDEKQILSDGSFLHSTFITNFFVHAVWQVYRTWSLSGCPVQEVYDVALWAAPVRSTPERAKRLSVQVDLAKLRQEMAQERRHRHFYEATVLAGVVLFVGFFAMGLTERYTVESTSDFIETLALLATLAGAAWGAYFKWSNR